VVRRGIAGVTVSGSRRERVNLRLPLVPGWARWGVVVAVAVVIAFQSVLVVPSESLPVSQFSLLDKWLHFFAYAGLGGALAYALSDGDQSRAARAATVFALAVGFGIGLELVQGTVPHRTMAFDDAVANALGAALSLAWYLLEPRVEFVPVPVEG
jgi:VanZ family protein